MHARTEENSQSPALALADTHQLRKRILKLRWIGMEAEAEILRKNAASESPEIGLFLGASDTD